MDFSDNKYLINSLKKGNQEAFTFMVRTYNHRLCVYANSLINNTIQAEDVVQNVFVKVWEKKETINVNHSLKSYL